MSLTWFGRLWDRHITTEYDADRKVHVAPFDCALHGQVRVWTRWGALCFAWPILGLGRQMSERGFGWYAYLSPNSTPWASTWAIGPGVERTDKKLARVRHALWGHNYDCTNLDPQVLDAALFVVESRCTFAEDELKNILNARRDWIRKEEA